MPAFARLVRGLMDEEVTPTLTVPPGADLAGYKASLLDRFANPALKHRTWQIAMDGSQKLPQRLLGTVRERLAAGAPIDRLALAVAAWMRYAAGVDEGGKPIDVRDPLAERLGRIGRESRPRRRASGAGLSRHPRDLRRRPAGRRALRRAGDARPRQPHPGRRQENSRKNIADRLRGCHETLLIPRCERQRASKDAPDSARWASCVLRGPPAASTSA